MLTPDENAVVQDNLTDTNEFQLFDTISPRETRKENIDIVDMKRTANYHKKVTNQNPLEAIVK